MNPFGKPIPNQPQNRFLKVQLTSPKPCFEILRNSTASLNDLNSACCFVSKSLYRLNFKTIHFLISNLNNKKDAVPFNKKIIRGTYKLKMLKPCLHTIIRTHQSTCWNACTNVYQLFHCRLETSDRGPAFKLYWLSICNNMISSTIWC